MAMLCNFQYIQYVFVEFLPTCFSRYGIFYFQHILAEKEFLGRVQGWEKSLHWVQIFPCLRLWVLKTACAEKFAFLVIAPIFLLSSFSVPCSPESSASSCPVPEVINAQIGWNGRSRWTGCCCFCFDRLCQTNETKPNQGQTKPNQLSKHRSD